MPNISLDQILLADPAFENVNQINQFGSMDQFNNLGLVNSQNLNHNYVDAEPIVINQDVYVPQPVVFKQIFVPKPYLPYSRCLKNGFPCFW